MNSYVSVTIKAEVNSMKIFASSRLDYQAIIICIFTFNVNLLPPNKFS